MARIDERTESMAKAIEKLTEKQDEQEKKYVTQDQFWPVKTIVYGGAGLVLIGVMGALLALVIVKT